MRSHAAYGRARAGIQSTRRAQGYEAEANFRVLRRSHYGLPVRPVQAHPFRVELGAGLTRSAPLGTQELLQIKGCLAFQHVIDRAGQFVRENTQGFAFVVFLLQTCQILLAGLVPAQEQRGRFSKGPCEVGVADCVPRCAQAFPPGCFGTLDETTIRGAILHAWEAVHVMDFVAQDEAEDVANAWDGRQEVPCLGIMLFRRFEDKEFEVAEHLIIIGDQSEVDFNGLLNSRVSTPLGDAVTIGFIGDFLADLGQVVLGVGMLDMRSQCSTLAHQVSTASE